MTRIYPSSLKCPKCGRVGRYYVHNSLMFYFTGGLVEEYRCVCGEIVSMTKVKRGSEVDDSLIEV